MLYVIKYLGVVVGSVERLGVACGDITVVLTATEREFLGRIVPVPRTS